MVMLRHEEQDEKSELTNNFGSGTIGLTFDTLAFTFNICKACQPAVERVELIASTEIWLLLA